MYFAQPSSVSSSSSKRWTMRARQRLGPSGSAGPMKTAPATRSGCSRRGGARAARPARARRARPARCRSASMTASASAASSSLRVAVGLRRAGPSRPLPRASKVSDAEVAREVRDLHLPVPRVDDRPGREEEHRRLPVAVDLVEDADAVALDVALLVGIARAGLLARGRRRPNSRHAPSLDSSHLSIHSRSSRWPVVIPCARSRMIPSLNVMTSATSASSGMSMP